jgi:hypothetical protein
MTASDSSVKHSPHQRILIKPLLLAVAGMAVGFAGYRGYEATQFVQPYAFNHAAHQVMKCTVCHAGAETDTRAGLPSFNICMNCHSTSPLIDGASVRVWNQGKEDGGLRWNKLTAVPTHVYFSHRRHTVLANLPCERCHGQMNVRTSPPMFPLERVRMGGCLDCHLKMNQTTDCAHCHR